MSRTDVGPAAREVVRPWMAVLLFALTSLAFVAPAIVDGPTMGATDIVTSFAPYEERSPTPLPADNPLQGDQAIQLPLPAEFWSALRGGDLQLWEPDIAGGTPLFGAVYNRLLSPLNWPFAVLPAAWAPTAGVLLGMFLAQLGLYGLARRLGLGVSGAALAGVAYAFSGPLTAFVLRFHEFFLLPAWLFAVHGVVTDRRRPWGFAALTTVMTAVVWFGGFPAAAVMSTYTVAVFGAWLLVGEARRAGAGRRTRLLLRRGGLAAVSAAAGMAVAAIQLLPTLAFLGETLARERTYGHHHLPVEALAMTLSGRFFGTPQDADWWWPDLVNLIESASGVGLVVLAALVAVVVGVPGRDDPRARHAMTWFVAPAAVLLLHADYVAAPVLGLFQRLPLLDETLFTRSRAVAVLLVALLAGWSVDRVVRGLDPADDRPRGPAPWPLRILVVYLPVLVALAVWRSAPRVVEAEQVRAVVKDLLVPGVAAGAAVLVLAWCVWRRRPVGRLALVLAVASAVELQFGAFGLTPASPTFYPDDPALDVIAEDTGAGGAYRYFDRPNLAFYGHSGAYRDLSDALAHWPAYGPYQQVLELSDPHVADASAGKAVFEPAFSDELDLGSPALDAVAAGWFLADLASPPEQVAPGTEVAAGATGNQFLVEEGLPVVRALVVAGASRAPDCHDGWVDLTVGDAAHRRLTRELPPSGDWTFPVPDLALAAGAEVSITATDCPVDVAGARLVALEPATDTDLELVSVDGWQAYRRPSAHPRLELATEVRVEADPEARLASIAARTDDAVVLSAGEPTTYRGGTATFVDDDPDRVEVAVDAAGPGLLVLRDVAAPGWSVAVDGETADLLDVDHAFRGVEVPDGESTVTFAYAPPGLRTGVLLAAAGLLALLALSVLAVREHQRDARRPGVGQVGSTSRRNFPV